MHVAHVAGRSSSLIRLATTRAIQLATKGVFSFQRISACYGTRFISNMTTTAAYLEIGIFPKQDGIK
jgi:hypothetical protein